MLDNSKNPLLRLEIEAFLQLQSQTCQLSVFSGREMKYVTINKKGNMENSEGFCLIYSNKYTTEQVKH